MDEHVPLAATTGLRRRGVDVSIALDGGLISVKDEEQLSHALQSGRVMVTHDNDYLRLHAAGVLHAGIAYCHQAVTVSRAENNSPSPGVDDFFWATRQRGSHRSAGCGA